MLKEHRVIMPLTVAEYQRGQLYTPAQIAMRVSSAPLYVIHWWIYIFRNPAAVKAFKYWGTSHLRTSPYSTDNTQLANTRTKSTTSTPNFRSGFADFAPTDSRGSTSTPGMVRNSLLESLDFCFISAHPYCFTELSAPDWDPEKQRLHITFETLHLDNDRGTTSNVNLTMATLIDQFSLFRHSDWPRMNFGAERWPTLTSPKTRDWAKRFEFDEWKV